MAPPPPRPPVSRVALRPYAPADRAAVLALFRSNQPDFFADSDRGWLEETLDEPDGPAFVATVDGHPLAFGGYELWDHYNKALLFWGMADRAAHGLGLGRLLLWERLRHVAAHARPATRWVTVDTSPRVSSFFERHGFELTARWPQGYRSGTTMHELRFDLAATDVEALTTARDRALVRAEARVATARGPASGN